MPGAGRLFSLPARAVQKCFFYATLHVFTTLSNTLSRVDFLFFVFVPRFILLKSSSYLFGNVLVSICSSLLRKYSSNNFNEAIKSPAILQTIVTAFPTLSRRYSEYMLSPDWFNFDSIVFLAFSLAENKLSKLIGNLGR